MTIKNGHQSCVHHRLSRRAFLKQPPALGLSALALAALGVDPSAQDANELGIDLTDHQPVPVRSGLGIVVVGASSGLGAELARQYASHGAHIVLAARLVEKLAAVAADVTARGGTAHVIPTDVRNEAECITLVHRAVAWLASRGKTIDLLALGAFRSQVAPFGPEMSSEVWRNVIATSYFGPALCLKEALPFLKANRSTLFYFNSILSSYALPQAIAYTSVKHAWRGMLYAIEAENPEITIVSSQFNAVDTEGFDKELTVFNDDRRYCPSFFKTYVAPAVEMYPAPLAIAKVVQAIERGDRNVFLSLLNKAAWLVAPTHQRLCGFLTVLELLLRSSVVQQLESEFRQTVSQSGAAGYMNRLLARLNRADGRNELADAASLLLSLDRDVSLFLLAIDDRLDEQTLSIARRRSGAFYQTAGDGTAAQLMLALSAGPAGSVTDNDGLALVTSCAPVVGIG
jgi:NAD(P)-dependent dehydrogenase (short-subunit alcohol dehydrogenase family)